MKTPSGFLTVVIVGALFAGSAFAASDVTDPKQPRSLPAEGPINVSWTDPAQFSEIRQSGNRWEAKRGDWVKQLAEYVRKRAARDLAPGQRLDVTITDIRRAGQFEPWHRASMSSTRVVRDIYPPRIELSFKLTDDGGGVLAQGDRKLTDLTFMMNSSPVGSSDTLRYERRLIDEWLGKEFKATGT